MTEVEVLLIPTPECKDFFSLSMEEKTKVIALGLLFRRHGANKVQFWENSEWEGKISALELEKNNIIDSLKQSIISQSKEYALSVDFIKDSQRIIYKNEIDTLNVNVKTLESDLDARNKQYNDLYSSLSDKLELKFKGQQDLMREEQQSLKQNLRELEIKKDEKIRDLEIKKDEKIRVLEEKLEMQRNKSEQMMRLNENSALKGKLGEQIMENQLNLLFPSSEVLDVHKEGHRGDFVLKDGDFAMMVENKAHNKGANVQKVDIDKLYKDCDDERNNDIQCAIMTALHNGICNRDDWEFEVRNGKPILFLHHVSSDWNKLPLAVKFLKLIVQQKDLDLSNKEIQIRFKNVASIIKRNFTRQRKILDKYCSEQKVCISQFEDSIVDLFTLVNMKY